ncbi:uncharacterized protein B4U79_05539, partial [Dinothrombium tinctorium]
MRLRKRNGELTFDYRCHRTINGVSHNKHKSALCNSWFERSRFGVDKILTLSYMFANGMTKYKDIIRETSTDVTTGMETVADWLSYCRETRQGQIGGHGVVVEIDKAKIGKRKYHRGRLVEDKCWKPSSPWRPFSVGDSSRTSRC